MRAPTIRYIVSVNFLLMVLVCIHAMWCDTAVRKPSINSEFEFVVLL